MSRAQWRRPPCSTSTVISRFGALRFCTISRPAISKHLRILVECDVVEVTVVGRQRVYALRTAPLADVAVYLDRLLGPSLPHQLHSTSHGAHHGTPMMKLAALTPAIESLLVK